jgi:hypothetical protein
MSRVEVYDVTGRLLEAYDLPDEATPLDPTGALATLLAVLEVTTVQDAANAVGLTPDDLIAEAQAWEAARS